MDHSTNSGGAKTLPIPARDIDAAAPATPSRQRTVLLVYHREGVEAAPLATGKPLVVGRSAPADVVVADDRLSRSHARVTLTEDGSVTVEDLGSLNGTWVGGHKAERASVRAGDALMFGAVPAAVHVLAGDDAPPLGLEGHDAFLAAVDAEIGRARHFERSFAVLVVHAGAGEKGLLPRWCPRVRQLLRPFDRIGFYGAGVVEIVMPEARLEQAVALGRSIVLRREGEPALVCGIAEYPWAGSSAATLLTSAREAARSADAGEPLRVSTSAPSTVISGGPAPSEADEVVLESPPMRELAKTAKRVARASISVILRGETGCGKEVLTRLIHQSGPRRSKPLVCVNCAAIPPSLVESTLFGHVKGAFTGAIGDRKGVFEEADGGTLLLDEIGELPAAAQAALLRALETRRITRVGSTREIAVDVRVIAATHRDLEAMSQTGAFRQDLFFRLNAMEVSIPPLRERPEDIPLLAAHFLAREAKANGRSAMNIGPEALALLLRHAWPGNVRELKNTVERAVVIAEGDTITPLDLPERIRGSAARGEDAAAPSPSVKVAAAHAEKTGAHAEKAPSGANVGAAGQVDTGSLKDRMLAFERRTIIAALRETGGHQTDAARLLDLPLRTLQHKIKAHGIKKHYHAEDGE